MKNTPINLEAERCLLSSILSNKIDTNIRTAIETLSVDDFYDPPHRELFSRVKTLLESDNPITSAGIIKTTKDPKLSLYLYDLADNWQAPTLAPHFAGLIIESSQLRRLLSLSNDIRRSIEGNSPISELLTKTEKDLENINSLIPVDDTFSHLGSIIPSTIGEIEDSYSNKPQGKGLSTGYKDLDNMINGLRRSELIVLGARPGVGKTSLALNIALNIGLSDPGLNIGLFSLEMSKEQISLRAICSQARSNSQLITAGKFSRDTFEGLIRSAGELSGVSLHIDDTPNIAIIELLNKAKKFHSKNKFSLIIIDHIQLITPPKRSGESRNIELGEISKRLKGLSRELDIPVLALSQLSRTTTKRENKRPLLSDLRESGAIEQDADIVLFIHNDNYYKADPTEDAVYSPAEKVEIIVAKNRSGSTGSINMTWLKEITRFENYSQVS